MSLDVQDVAADQPAVEAPVASTAWFYCLESYHPGAKEVISDARFFEGSLDTPCPVCPACGKQVTAVPVQGQGVYPASLLALAERLI